MARADYVAYYRLSSATEEQSRLDLEAQRETVKTCLMGGLGKIVSEFIEIEKGRNPLRPKLQEALAAARRFQVPLIVAKLGRLTRSVSFLRLARDSKVMIVFAEMPDAHDLTVHILASVAEWEAEKSNDRRVAALAAPKPHLQKPSAASAVEMDTSQDHARGTAAQIARRKKLAPAIAELRAAGEMPLYALAKMLTEKGIPTARGHSVWTASQVSRVLASMDK